MEELATDKTKMHSSIRATLISMAEPEYQRFASGLLPGVENIMGVRLPKLRKLAKQVAKAYGAAYLDEALDQSDGQLPMADDYAGHVEYMEEILLQGMVIGGLKVCAEEPAKASGADSVNSVSVEQILDYIRKYVPKISNWSTCDSFCAGLKFTKGHQEEMWKFLQDYLVSDRDYDVRFGLVMIINYYIQEAYLEKLFEIFSQVGEAWNNHNKGCSNEEQESMQGIYYVEMALAWALSICYVRYPDRTLAYLEEMQSAVSTLDDFTYNKALQKIVESRCISQEKKAEIRRMKRKNK